MATLFRTLVLALLIFGAWSPRSFAQDSATDIFEQKLKKYDPDVVEAARGYAQTMNFKSLMEKSVPALTSAITRQVEAKNPELNARQVGDFVDAFLKSALVDTAPVMQEATVLMMLDIFSKEELLALNKFYSSPVGKGIVAKMPIMMGRMPELMQVLQTQVIPRALAKARDQMKKNGVDVRI